MSGETPSPDDQYFRIKQIFPINIYMGNTWWIDILKGILNPNKTLLGSDNI